MQISDGGGTPQCMTREAERAELACSGLWRADAFDPRRNHAPQATVRPRKIEVLYFLTAYPLHESMLKGVRLGRVRGLRWQEKARRLIDKPG